MLSIPHLIIVFVVALVVFGPEKLPELARNLGKIMGEFKRATGDLRSTFEGHLRDLEREADQRRIANLPTTPPPPAPLPASSSAASAAAMEEEISSALGAPGTVPTTPPHLGIGTPLTEPSLAEGALEEATKTETATTEIAPTASTTEAEVPQPPPTLAIEHHP